MEKKKDVKEQHKGGRPSKGKAANTVPIPAKISATLDKSLTKICKRKRMTRSEVVREAIQQFVEQHAQEMITSGAS